MPRWVVFSEGKADAVSRDSMLVIYQLRLGVIINHVHTNQPVECYSFSHEHSFEDIEVMDNYESESSSKLHLYFDESNNGRKLQIKNGKLNLENWVIFTLGGIGLAENSSIDDWDVFRKLLNINSNADEVHFAQVAKGALPNVLKSLKLKNYFKWLIKNKYVIHFTVVDVMYWATLDIVDSLIHEADVPSAPLIHRELKTEFLKFFIESKKEFVTVFDQLNFPNIAAGTESRFIKELSRLIPKKFQGYNDIQIALSFMISSLIDKDVKLPLFKENENGVLVNDLAGFFMHIAKVHYEKPKTFDEETSVMEILRNSADNDFENSLNIKFRKSDDEPGIQLSDVLSGFLRVYFTFICRLSLDEIKEFKSNLNHDQLEVLNLFRTLIDNSDELDPTLLFSVLSIDTWNAHEALLWGAD